MSYTNFPNGLTSFGIPVHGSLPFTMANSGVGVIHYVDTNNGSNGNDGLSPTKALATVNQAYSNAVSNRGDIIVIAGSSSSNTLSAPLAVTKSRLTFIGADPVGRMAQQGAKVSTSSTESSASYVIKNTGTRNAFVNLKLIQNSTNAAALTVYEDGGEGTLLMNSSFTFGVADNLGGTTAHEFVAGSDTMTALNCVFGQDTLLTSDARAVMLIDQVTSGQEFKSNYMENCLFVISSSSANASMITVAANTDVLFSNTFKNCTFVASLDSAGGAAVTNAVTSAGSLVKGTLNFDMPRAFGFTNFCAGTTAHVQTYGPATSAQAGEAGTPA